MSTSLPFQPTQATVVALSKIQEYEVLSLLRHSEERERKIFQALGSSRFCVLSTSMFESFDEAIPIIPYHAHQALMFLNLQQAGEGPHILASCLGLFVYLE